MSSADLWERLKGISAYRFRTWPGRYGFALLAVAVATALQLVLRWMGFLHFPYLLYVLAVILAAVLAGFWPGIVTTLLATFAGGYILFSPATASKVLTPDDMLKPALFLIVGVSLTILASRRQRTKEALRMLDADLNRAQTVAHIGSWRGELQERTLTLSEEACRILGVSPGSHITLDRGMETIHAEDRERVREAFRAALGRAGAYEVETRIWVEGNIRWVNVLANIETDAEGRPAAAVGTVQDITERKLTHERLQEFERVVQGLEEMIVVVNRDYRYVIANPAFLKYRGMTREQVIGHQVAEVLNPEVFEATVKGKLDECFQGKVVQYELHYEHPSLGGRDFLISYFPIDGAGKIDRVAAILQDITMRKQAERALRESEDRYRDLVEHSEDLLCTHDLDGRLLSVNPAPARILGYKVAELLKMSMRELIAPEFRDQFDAYLARIKTSGADHGLMCVLTRSGERRIWEYNNTLRTEGVPAPVVRGMAHDVTERKRAETALRRREEDYRSFVAQSSEGIFREELDAPLPIDLPEEELVHRIIHDSYTAECNDALAKMYGFESSKQLVGKRLTEMLVPDDPRNLELTREYIRSGFRLLERESHELDSQGNPKVFRNSVIGIVENEKLVRTWGIQRDVTERVKAEEALQQSEERFRVALKGSPIAVFSQDRDLRYTWIYNFASFPPNQLLGKTDEEIIGVDKARRLRELKQQVLKSGTGVREEIAIPYQGKTYAYDITVEPLFDATGGIVGITGAAMDIARLRELADSLQTTKERLVQEKRYLENEIETELGFEKIIGQDRALRQVLKDARVVAPTGSSVLLLGETGTGKELVARAIHSLSERRDRNFIKLNCAAVPTGLLESELFGHEKGAFTGAVSQKIGRLELADKGTLFLDEIGELPLELQPKLLRVLQDWEFERLGGVRTLRVDVRIISATNRDLKQHVEEKKFREDLFYRLNVFPISLPSLRERRSDIPMLVRYFVEKHAARMGKRIETIPDETISILQNWSWPGNIRELENLLERMVILTKGAVLAPPPLELDVSPDVIGGKLTEIEREHVIQVLRETNGVLSGADGASSRLGIKRTTLQSMLKRFGIEPQEFRKGSGTFDREQ